MAPINSGRTAWLVLLYNESKLISVVVLVLVVAQLGPWLRIDSQTLVEIGYPAPFKTVENRVYYEFWSLQATEKATTWSAD